MAISMKKDKTIVFFLSTLITLYMTVSAFSISAKAETVSQHIVNIALSQVGTAERSAGSDDIMYNDWYFGTHSPGYQWCAIFVSWCANEAGVLNKALPKTTLAKDFWNKAANYGGTTHRRGDGYKPVAGDIVVINWDHTNSASDIHHVGIVEYTDSSGYVHYIDGNNTSTTPHSVVQSKRHFSNNADIYGYIHPNYEKDDDLPRGDINGWDASDGKLHVVGWAFDDDTPAQAVEVHVYVGGKAGEAGSEGHNVGLANVQREEAVGQHGFDVTFDTDLSGMQQFYVYLLDTGGNGHTEYGPFQVLIPVPNDYLLNPAVYNDAWYAQWNDGVRDMTPEQRRQYWIETGSFGGEQASPAFFAIEYRDLYGDLQAAFDGSNYQLLIEHFIEHGIHEFRSGRGMFNPGYYKGNYKDLQDAYGDDNESYYSHFAVYGYNEGRTADHRLQLYFDMSNGGSCTETQRDLTIGQALGTLPALNREGYTGAWYTAKTGGTKVTSSYIPDGDEDLRIYAQWLPIKVTGISIPGTQTLSIGESKTLTAVITPDDALNKGVSWKSSDTSVVTVTNGTIKGVKEGTATVTATASDGSGVSAGCTVTVRPTITGLTLNRSSLQLADEGAGSSYLLKVEKTPVNGQGTVNWSSSNTAVARVTQDGVVTAQGTGTTGTGTATITASIINGPSVSCTVNVVGSMPIMTLPADLKTIEEEAFLNTAAARIVIPSGVESIGAGAFAHSSALKYVAVPDSVVSIGDGAFADDPDLCLICSENSAAKEYAVANGIEYTTEGASGN